MGGRPNAVAGRADASLEASAGSLSALYPDEDGALLGACSPASAAALAVRQVRRRVPVPCCWGFGGGLTLALHGGGCLS